MSEVIETKKKMNLNFNVKRTLQIKIVLIMKNVFIYKM